MWPVAIGIHAASRIAAALLLLWAFDAIAADTKRNTADDDATFVAGDFPRPALEVTTTKVPRFDSVDMAVMPQQGSGMGLSFGISTFTPTQPLMAPGGLQSHSLDLGVRWRYTLDGTTRFDVTAYRHVPNNDAMSLIESRDPGYGARVEMALGGTQKLQKGFATQKAFIGLQLESGARLYLKRSGGGPMLYYRNTF
jgi:hypothetical protein